MPRTSPGWLTLLLGCLLLLTGCAIDPEHFDGLNPVPGAARRDVAYSEMRALRAVAAAQAGASGRDASGTGASAGGMSAGGGDAVAWRPCASVDEVTAGLQCGSLAVPGGTATVPSVTLAVVRRPATDPAARQGVAVLAVDPDASARPPAADAPFRQLNRTFDLVTVHARTVADLDAVRAALGEQSWSLIGSGPAAATVAGYVQAHPDHTRAAVLDRPVAAVHTASGPAPPESPVTARTCEAGTAAQGAGGAALAAASAGCPAPPVLVLAATADGVGDRAAGERAGGGPAAGDGWGGILLTVGDGAGEPTGTLDAGSCADAAIESFILTLGLPADGPCA